LFRLFFVVVVENRRHVTRRTKTENVTARYRRDNNNHDEIKTTACLTTHNPEGLAVSTNERILYSHASSSMASTGIDGGCNLSCDGGCFSE
jgi:Tfp pilus tip-associated adhesin PilY1